MGEIWRDIIGYEGFYQVSNQGNVKGLRRKKYNYKNCIIEEKILKKSKNNRGYLSVRLTKNGKSDGYSLHYLVAKMFIPNPENKLTVNHKDLNKQNNCIENLEWATDQENKIHAVKNGIKFGGNHEYAMGERSSKSKLKNEQIIKIRSMYPLLSQPKIARLYNVGKSAINRIINRKTWKHI